MGMIRIIEENFSQDQWDSLASRFPDYNLIQTWEYGQAKSMTAPWDVCRFLIKQGQNTMGVFQAMLRWIPGIRRGLVWINRGPLWDRQTSPTTFLGELLNELRRYWVVERKMYLRIALPLFEGEMTQLPENCLGYRLTGCPGWASERVDLSLSLEQLRFRMQQKWRNCLYKAERQGIAIKIDSTPDHFRVFLNAYRDNIREKGFLTVITPEFLEALQEQLPLERKLTVLTGTLQGNAIGHFLTVRYGSTGEYLAGVMPREGRNLNIGQLLLWQAVVYAKSRGLRWFDLGGLDPQRTPKGILHFKSGFQGQPYRLAEEIQTHNGSLLSRLVEWRAQKANPARPADCAEDQNRELVANP